MGGSQLPGSSEFAVPTANSNPANITSGPDGNLWFTESTGNKIGRITPDGVITEFSIPTANTGPEAITTGPDGNLWFAEFNSNRIGEISPTGGAINEFTIPTSNSQPVGITLGPDGNLWFAENAGNKIGKFNFKETALANAGHGVSYRQWEQRQYHRRHDNGGPKHHQREYGLWRQSFGTDTMNNTVVGNYIGVDVAGSAAIANSSGVSISFGAHDNTIGGATAAARNIISRNTDSV